MLSKLAATCFQISLLSAQSADPGLEYPEFEEIAAKYGYGWEPHTVYSEDGWKLTLLRITAVKDVPIQSEKPPVFMIHGATDSGFNWVHGPFFKPGLPGLLAEQGYDVWVGNSRGTPYSNYNIKDGTWSLKERWDFDWSDMGQYDISAFVDKVLEVTGKPKVTMMGYSQGGA